MKRDEPSLVEHQVCGNVKGVGFYGFWERRAR
jgi:hypothetical protein